MRRGRIRLPGRRRVDAELRQAMACQLRLHGGRRDLIGVLQFDRGKTRGGGSAEALEQRIFGEQMAEIGGKARHSTFLGVSFYRRSLARIVRLKQAAPRHSSCGALI